MRRCSGLLFAWCMSLTAQPAADPFLEWMDRQAQALLDQREAAVAQVRTVAAADARRAAVREKILASMGGLPDWNGPLRARVTGQLRSDTHTVEKVLFDSLPGFPVSGNLYRPNAAGRYPGILLPAGHTQEGKPEAQELAANLAAKGFVVLTYDPIGQGEREQTYLPELGRALSGGGGNEHLELGARSLLLGQSVARYFIQDAKRGIDYLVSRPEVDPGRIGVTGCSGGGAITTYIAAFDARVKAAAPGCFINTFRKLFPGNTADSEMSLPQFLANGLDLADFFAMAAPLPWLMLATEEDYFTPEGARPVYEEVRKWYALYGAEDRVRFFVGPGPHGTPRESREEIYRWMTRWLKDGRGETRDQPVKLYTNLELQVTASGNVYGEPGSRKLHVVLAEEYRKRREPRSLAALEAELRRLGVAWNGAAPPAESGARTEQVNYTTEEIWLTSEPGVRIAGRLYVPKGTGRKGAVVVLEETRMPVPLYVQRSQSTAAICDAMARSGQVVLELQPRDSPGAYEGRPFLGNWVTNERADLIGRNLATMRAHDVLAGVAWLAARADVEPGAIRGYARGVKGFWLLAAAAVDRRLARIWLDRMPVSMELAFASPLAGFLFDAMIPSFVRHWDIGDLVRVAGEKRLFRTDPANWMNRVIRTGPEYRYRLVGEGDAALLAEFLR